MIINIDISFFLGWHCLIDFMALALLLKIFFNLSNNNELFSCFVNNISIFFPYV